MCHLRPLVVFIIATGLYAQDQSAKVTQACASVANLIVPKGDPSAKCEAPANLYYGTNGAPDYAAARRCALSQWHNFKRPLDGVDDETVIMPIATLVMVYANGEGVPRNVDLAIHIVCKDDPSSHSWGAFDQVITQLLSIKDRPSLRFDFCSSGIDFWKRVDGECLDIEGKIDEKKHMLPLLQLMASWTAPQKAAFARMMKSFDKFVSLQSGLETTGGSGTGNQLIEADHDLRVAFIDFIVHLDTGHLPNFTHQNYLDSDKTLNLTYKQLLTRPPPTPDGVCKETQDIRDTERAWLSFRESWIAFARVRWPQVSTQSWLTLLNQERTNTLRNVTCED